jgi:hypothetical protein
MAVLVKRSAVHINVIVKRNSAFMGLNFDDNTLGGAGLPSMFLLTALS